jgi:hypothetical protein
MRVAVRPKIVDAARIGELFDFFTAAFDAAEQMIPHQSRT